MIKFVLLVNKQGQTRLSRYAVGARPPPALRAAFEGEVVRKCLTRSDKQVRERRCRWQKEKEGRGASKQSLSVAILPFFSECVRNFFTRRRPRG